MRIRKFRNAFCKRFVDDSSLIKEFSVRGSATSENLIEGNAANQVVFDGLQLHCLEIAKHCDSEIDGATKLLMRTEDGLLLETVILRIETGRTTLCVSSQVGCAAACDFCATGKMGVAKNLSAGQILDQVVLAGQLLSKENRRLRNIVFMGMGEPFHNFEAMVDAVNILTCDYGLGLGGRKITVSTSGLVDKIEEFGLRTNANLAIPLNATTDEMRSDIMPINKKWNLASLMKACRTYPMSPRRRITFEYVLLGGLNDTIDDAKRMIQLLRGVAAKVNLIPYNPHPASPDKRPKLETVYKMQRYLLDRGMNCTVRISKGKDILAVCGQLRSKEAKKRLHRRYFEKKSAQKNPDSATLPA